MRRAAAGSRTAEEKTVRAEELVSLMNREFSTGRPLQLTVTGYSMGPCLKHLRDQVVLVPPEKRALKRGEIVFFRRTDGKCVLHRILRAEKEGVFVVNGDAQAWTEDIRKEQILAAAKAVIRKERYISCDGKRYRIFVALWQMLFPVRGIMIRIASARWRFRERNGRTEKK
ncbi:hypothetical protein B5F07_14055 [Lachnoclostridium sp. An169]|uniref:S24/S26 family peptidase n=1 Tax=Lachnoclostridium sp. An169 TaxID=1965569 RepID=UPI000B393F65|nr:S24/S26 family peptidase [Lachnoclostridium sp. An169]OUP82433.1 hypothetical protein B5F07_14055 [Lachnoclostridium sp. An169]